MKRIPQASLRLFEVLLYKTIFLTFDPWHLNINLHILVNSKQSSNIVNDIKWAQLRLLSLLSKTVSCTHVMGWQKLIFSVFSWSPSWNGWSGPYLQPGPSLVADTDNQYISGTFWYILWVICLGVPEYLAWSPSILYRSEVLWQTHSLLIKKNIDKIT